MKEISLGKGGKNAISSRENDHFPLEKLLPLRALSLGKRTFFIGKNPINQRISLGTICFFH